MPVDLTGLNAQIAALEAEAQRTEGTEDSAAVIINGLSKAITDEVAKVLEADAAANDASIAAAKQAIADVTARFIAADDKLGAAIAANPGQPQS